MTQIPNHDLYGRKNAGFSYNVLLVGADYSAEAFTSHIREYKDAPDLIQAITVAFVSVVNQTYQQSIDLGYRSTVPVGKLLTDTEDVSTLSLTITKANMSNLPISGSQDGAPKKYVWDVQLNSGETEVIVEGNFIVDGGVTQQ